jgi:hypothetical protein
MTLYKCAIRVPSELRINNVKINVHASITDNTHIYAGLAVRFIRVTHNRYIESSIFRDMLRNGNE